MADLRDELVGWLEERREAASVVADALAIPPSVTLPVWLWTIDDSGRGTGRREMRETSGFAVSDFGFMIVRSMSPYIDESAITIVERLIDQYASTIQWSGLLAGNLTGLVPPSEEASVAGTVWATNPRNSALGLLGRALDTYLSRLNSLDIPLADLARSLADDILAFASSKTVTSVFAMPLAGADTSTLPLQTKQVLLRRLTDEESGRLHAPSRGSPFISGSVMDRDPSMANFVIEVRDQVSKDVDHFKLRSTIPHDGVCPRALVSALLLLGFRLRGSDISHHIEPMWLNVGQSSGQLELNLQADQPLKPLTLSELEQAMAIAKRVGALSRTGTLALNRLLLAGGRFSPTDRIIDCSVVLESLFAPSNVGESSFRLAALGAGYLGSNNAERLRIYRNLRTVYDARSQVVHGSGLTRRAADLGSAAERAWELSRSALLKAITTEWPDETKLPELLFGSEDSDA